MMRQAIMFASFSAPLPDSFPRWFGNLCFCSFVFGVTALFPLIVSTSALLIDEKPISAQPATSLPSSHGDAAASSSAASVGADNDGDLKKAEDLALLPRAVAQQVW
eukprot:1158487-Pelagomonas_calceolata.AAC.8